MSDPHSFDKPLISPNESCHLACIAFHCQRMPYFIITPAIMRYSNNEIRSEITSASCQMKSQSRIVERMQKLFTYLQPNLLRSKPHTVTAPIPYRSPSNHQATQSFYSMFILNFSVCFEPQNLLSRDQIYLDVQKIFIV